MILEGKDLIACAQTGTGKTAAYTLPILNRLIKEENRTDAVKAVIMDPTRELAQQIDVQFEGLSYFLPVSTVVVYGGGDGSLWDQQKKALRLGAKGYLLKQDYASILPALRAVYSGQTVFGQEIVSKIPDLIQKKENFDYSVCEINEKEKEIIRLVANGYSNKEIAAEMYLGEGTVRNYLSSILDKLQLRDRTQVAVFYYKHR